MQQFSQKLIVRALLFFIVIFVILSGLTFSLSKELLLSFSVKPSGDTVIQLYFETGDGPNISSSRVKANEEKILEYRMPGDTKSIRIDPALGPLELIFNEGEIRRVFSAQGTPISAKCLIAQHQVEVLPGIEHAIRIKSVGDDPQVLISDSCFPQSAHPRQVFAEFLTSLVLVSLASALALNATWPVRQRMVPVLISMAAGSLIVLVGLVALLSRVNLHPDEYSHIAAATFFQGHWFKLAVNHPEMLKTLIPGWGTSYLFLNDIVYSLAEKFTAFLVSLEVPHYLKYRLFNFALLPLLLVPFITDRRNGIWFLLAFVLSTQTWYLFAYFNGDALSMFSSFLLAYYFISNRSQIERFFWEESDFTVEILLFYALCVLVLFTRLHYMIFVFFIIGLIPVLKLAEGEFKAVGIRSFRIALFALLVALPVGLEELKDQWVNNFSKAETIEILQKDHKRPEFSFEHIKDTGENPYSLYLKPLGRPYTDVFSDRPWIEWSYQSFFGVYGFMNIKATKSFYVLSSILGMGVTLLFLAFSAIKADWRFGILVVYLAAFAGLVILQSTMYSWLIAVQAQGRYMLAIIPMIAVILALNPARRTVPKVYVQSYLLVIFLLNILGFTIYGVIPMTSNG